MENNMKREPSLPNVDEEWKKFVQDVIRPSQSGLQRKWRKVAASLILFLSVAILSFAAGVYYKSHRFSSDETQSEEISKQTGTPTVENEASFDYKSVDLQTIVQELGQYYGLVPEFRSEEAKHLRLHVNIDKKLSVQEVVDLLNNFQKVHIKIEGNKMIVE